MFKRKFNLWTFQGYDGLTKEGKLTNPVIVEVIAKTEAEARGIAKALTNKPNYIFTQVVQYFK